MIGGTVKREVRTFKTMTTDLLAHGLVRAKLRAGRRDPGAARPATHPQATGARAQQPRPALAKDGDHRCHGTERQSHDRGPGRRRDRSCHAGRARSPANQDVAGDVARSITRPGDQPSPFPARTAIAQRRPSRGVGDLGACVILAEIGHDMSRFPTQGHLSAGKRRSSACARAPRAKDRPSNAPGRERARMAVISRPIPTSARSPRRQVGDRRSAHPCSSAHHMLKDGTFYQDLGADHFDRRASSAQIKRLLAKLQNL
jgi:hypothetical protein